MLRRIQKSPEEKIIVQNSTWTDTDIRLCYVHGGIHYNLTYMISAPEDKKTHLLWIEKVENVTPIYSVVIQHDFDRQVVGDFIVCKTPDQKGLEEFYENFGGGFAVCLIEQGRPAPGADKAIFN